MSDDGREVLSYLAGEVPQYPMPEWARAKEALTSSVVLLRELHEVTRDCDQTGPWRSPTREPAEVVCHNDFAPYNVVYSEGRATLVIDFDFASPGPRQWDLAYLDVWRRGVAVREDLDGLV